MHAFLEKFSQCEVYVRPILKQYYCDIGEEKEDDEIALVSKDIKDACDENGIYFVDKRIVTRIFGAEDAVNRSSCRWLRNKITHELMRRVDFRYESIHRTDQRTAVEKYRIEKLNK